jgi:hypothetical protein
VARLVMRFSAAVEVVTGLALLAIPSVVIGALVGTDGGATSTVVGRILGGALVGLGIAGASVSASPPERRIVLGYVAYDMLTAAVLAVASISGTAGGVLLWPVVAVHTILAVVLLGSLLASASFRSSGDSRSGLRPRGQARPDGVNE